MIKFKKNYFLLFIIVFVLELFIEKSTGFIRYTLGDFFAVILLYALIRSFINIKYTSAGFTALIIAYFIEFIQLFNLSHFYPEKYKYALQIIIGTSFSFGDLLAYSLGIILTILIERRLRK
jgi:hypothetical protein